MITYTANQRRYANLNNMDLITIEVPGMNFQGPVPKEESQMLDEYLIAFFKRWFANIKQPAVEKPSSTSIERECAERECADWIKVRVGTEYAWPDDEIQRDAELMGFSVATYRRAKTSLKREGLRTQPPIANFPWMIAFGNPNEMPLRPVKTEEHS
jgi:hypothetical protein